MAVQYDGGSKYWSPLFLLLSGSGQSSVLKEMDGGIESDPEVMKKLLSDGDKSFTNASDLALLL